MNFDIAKVSWDRVKNPNDRFVWFVPDPENPIEWHKKVVMFKKHLMDKFLYISDEFRNPVVINQLVDGFFFANQFNLFYELGDFQGLIGFLRIIPGYKASVMFKIWDKDAWTKENARAIKNLGDTIMDELQLERMSVQTPDRRMVKLSRIMGFSVEGKQPKDFKWENKLYTVYQLGRVKEDEKQINETTNSEPEKTAKTIKPKETKPAKKSKEIKEEQCVAEKDKK